MDMQKLKEAASAVLGWSSCDKAWLDTSEDESAAVFGHIDEDGNTYPVATIDCDQYYQGQDSLKLARFYAAANPAKVLYLITEIEQLRAQNAALKAELAEARKDAERYRFLRMQYMLIEFVIPDPERRVISVESFNTCTDDALALDAAIDAAMKGK